MPYDELPNIVYWQSYDFLCTQHKCWIKHEKRSLPFNATAPKFQFWEELNDIQHKGMSINDYTILIRYLHYALSSIDM